MDDIELILDLLSYFDKLHLCKLMSTEEGNVLFIILNKSEFQLKRSNKDSVYVKAPFNQIPNAFSDNGFIALTNVVRTKIHDKLQLGYGIKLSDSLTDLLKDELNNIKRNDIKYEKIDTIKYYSI